MADETKKDEWDTTQWYEVKEGDTLWKIAEHHYGDRSLCTKIMTQLGMDVPDALKKS